MTELYRPVPRPMPTDKVTFEKCPAWCDEETWAKWVDGEVRMHFG